MAAVALSPQIEALLCESPEVIRQTIKAMPPRQLLRLLHSWEFWGRPDQVWRPGAETHTFYLAGRGWGKTRVGSEAVRYVGLNPHLAGGRERKGPNDSTYGRGAVIGIAGRTANDVNQTMLYGPSGLMSITPEEERPRHYKQDKILVWPNGCVARLMSGDVPNSFRGPNFGFIWTDEMAHWAKVADSHEQMMLAFRHGKKPRAVHTTTPIAISVLIKMLWETDEDGQPIQAVDGEPQLQGFRLKRNVRAIVGATYDNYANLAESYLTETVAEHEGSATADQEIRGVIMFETPGAPWKRDWIKRCALKDLPDIVSIAIGVDPTVSDEKTIKTGEKNEAGIVVVGVDRFGGLWVLEDASGPMSTGAWARTVVRMWRKWEADTVFVEDNNGGELVETAIREAAKGVRISVERVHATRNKYERAGLVSHVWENGNAHHVGEARGFVKLEHQICHYDPEKSDKDQLSDRMDALVWACLGVAGNGTDRRRLRGLSNPQAWAKIAENLR